ncbi:MAG: lyase family protein, partial [Chloroflexota bacterium]|nr:lyase family protein [Chloroflexota bacterium]
MTLDALSPLDGRYAAQTAEVAAQFSEAALMRRRVQVEVAWLLTMAAGDWMPEVRPLTAAEVARLHGLVDDFSDTDAARVKEIEQTTRHDVKAVEYFIKERLRDTSLADVAEFVHFACTSEDINNLAYALMLRAGIREVWLPQAERVVACVAA